MALLVNAQAVVHVSGEIFLKLTSRDTTQTPRRVLRYEHSGMRRT